MLRLCVVSLLSQNGGQQSGQASQRGPNATGVNKMGTVRSESRALGPDPDTAGKSCLQVVAMALNDSGIRDTTRVLGVSPTTVMTAFKKTASLGAMEMKHSL
jgi:hypothetical protein